MKGGDKKVSTLEVAIVAEKGIDDVDEKSNKEGEDEVKETESESWEDAVEEIEKDEGGETEGASDTPASEKAESPPQDESKTTSAALQLPLYTLTIQLEYTPSSDESVTLYTKLLMRLVSAKWRLLNRYVRMLAL